jgi:DNA transformation protein
MSYYKAPEEIYDDPEQAAYWAKQGFQAALRANAIKLKRAANRRPKK